MYVLGVWSSATHPHPSAGAPAPCCFGHRRLAELREIAASDCEVHDPWAGATAYVRVRRLDWFYPHPFTVAGSVALDAKDALATGCPRALLIHITPERRWTLSLAKMALRLGARSDAHLPLVSVTGPLPAPPHLEQLACAVAAGTPLLLVGAGSGVTPGIALLRMLASRQLPPHARVRFVVVIRSPLVAEALDGFMLPDAHGCTGAPWLTTEIHLTRAAPGTAAPPSTAACTAACTGASSPPPSPATCAHAASTRGPHAFRGGFRLASEADGQGAAVLRAVSAPYAVSRPVKGGDASAAAGPAVPRRSRSAAADELMSVAGAAAGFVAVAWPLLWRLDDALLAGQPNVISGLGGLVLAWMGALLGALAALALSDVARCYFPWPPTVALRRKITAMASEGSTRPSEGKS